MGEREVRRRLCDYTPSRSACQGLAVSRFRICGFSLDFANRSGSLTFRSLPQLRTVVKPSQYRVSQYRVSLPTTAQVVVTVRILPQLGTAVKTSRSHVSVQLAVQQNNQFGNRQTKNNTLQCVIRNRHFASLRNHSAFSSLPQPETVVKPSQYHVCESTRFSRSVCGFRARSPFPALTLVVYHTLEPLSRPRSLSFPSLPFAVSRNRAGLSL